MSNGLIVLIIVIAVLLIVAYIAAVLLRKRNDALLAKLEEHKEELYNLPVNDEVEAVKNMHLIGQSQVLLPILKTIFLRQKVTIIRFDF